MFKITIERAPIGVEFEVGSISEAIGILEQEDSNLRKVVSIADHLNTEASDAPTTETTATEDAPAAQEVSEPEKKRRGRPPKAAPEAVAPAPIPVPPAAAPPTVPASPAEQVAAAIANGGGIPDFLKASAAAPPPPPPLPAPAPVPAAAPPSGILAGKVIADLDKRKATTADEGKSLADWLAAYGVVNAGASYDEAIAVIRLMADDKLSQVATALQVA